MNLWVINKLQFSFTCAACKLLPLAAYPHLTDLSIGPTKPPVLELPTAAQQTSNEHL